MYRYKVKHNPFRRLKMAFKSRKRTRGNIFLGVVTTILASLSFTAMSACAKALAPISSEEMTFFRGLVGLILQGNINLCFLFEGSSAVRLCFFTSFPSRG